MKEDLDKQNMAVDADKVYQSDDNEQASQKSNEEKQSMTSGQLRRWKLLKEQNREGLPRKIAVDAAMISTNLKFLK